jgi:hypothetical protein
MSANPLNNAEAAARIGIKPGTLRIWRHTGKGPRFTKNDERSKQSGVTYELADIEAWKAERKFSSTSAYSPNAKQNKSSPSDAAA